MMKTVWRVPPKLIKELIQPSPSSYLFKGNKNTILKICILMFITAASFITVKAWNQPTTALDDQIKRTCFTYTVLFTIKRGNPAICNNMGELESIMPRETVRQSGTWKYCWCHACELTEKRNHVKNGFMYRENRLVDAIKPGG